MGKEILVTKLTPNKLPNTCKFIIEFSYAGSHLFVIFWKSQIIQFPCPSWNLPHDAPQHDSSSDRWRCESNFNFATVQLHSPAGQSPQTVATAVCRGVAASGAAGVVASTFIWLDKRPTKSLILSGQTADSCAESRSQGSSSCAPQSPAFYTAMETNPENRFRDQRWRPKKIKFNVRQVYPCPPKSC